jgi:translation initiation factor 3 subunit I
VWGALDKCIYASTTNGKVICFDIQSGKEMYQARMHLNEVFSLHMSHDFTMLVSCSNDGTAKLLDPTSLKEIREFKYGKPCRSAVLSPLYDDPQHQKFHILTAGGQDAKDVT